MALAPGTRSGRYVVAELVGAGGMGEVYRAYDPRLDRHVAIKILPAFLAGSAESQQRFEREIHAISKLHHKNICVVYDTGDHEGQPPPIWPTHPARDIVA
jgi:serine/threonine protein kinase